MKKKTIIPTIALVAILGAFAFSSVPVSAQDPVYSNLVTKIAQRFGLKEADVQEVVKEVQEEHFFNRKVNFEEHLNNAVTDGKITEEQKQLILSKHTEVESKLTELKDLSESERHEKMKAIFDEVRQWAEDNDIDTKEFKFFGMGGEGKRVFMYRHMDK